MIEFESYYLVFVYQKILTEFASPFIDSSNIQL